MLLVSTKSKIYRLLFLMGCVHSVVPFFFGSGMEPGSLMVLPPEVSFECIDPVDTVDAKCAVGESQLSLSIMDNAPGQVGFRLTNIGRGRSVVNEIYVADEAGLLRSDPVVMANEGLVHFNVDKRGHSFPTKIPTNPSEEVKADVTLVRRPEISRVGRLLRANGVGNDERDALTMIMKTQNEALDADLVVDATEDCLFRVAIVMTGFASDPSARRTFVSKCSPTEA